MIVAAAVVASGFGALARYALAGLVQGRTTPGTRPVGTAAANVSGAILLGLLTGLHARGVVDEDVTALAAMGFLGGFTTFSAWMVETIALARDDLDAGRGAAAWNLGGMLIAGVLGVALSVVVA